MPASKSAFGHWTERHTSNFQKRILLAHQVAAAATLPRYFLSIVRHFTWDTLKWASPGGVELYGASWRGQETHVYSLQLHCHFFFLTVNLPSALIQTTIQIFTIRRGKNRDVAVLYGSETWLFLHALLTAIRRKAAVTNLCYKWPQVLPTA